MRFITFRARKQARLVKSNPPVKRKVKIYCFRNVCDVSFRGFPAVFLESFQVIELPSFQQKLIELHKTAALLTNLML
jgi:hypothetical protein